LSVMVNDRPQVMTADQLQLAGLEPALEQHYRLAMAGGAQFQRLLDGGDGKAVHFRVQRCRALQWAMPIGDALDHRQCPAAGQALGQTVVVMQGRQVDQGTCWTHGKSTGMTIETGPRDGGTPSARISDSAG